MNTFYKVKSQKSKVKNTIQKLKFSHFWIFTYNFAFCLLNFELKPLKQVLAALLIFQFLTVPLYPSLSISVVYAQNECQRMAEANGENPAVVCGGSGGSRSEPEPEYVPPPVYEPPVYQQPRYQSPVYTPPAPDEPVYEESPAEEAPPAEVVPSDTVPEEVVPPAGESYQGCLQTYSADICDQLYGGGQTPVAPSEESGGVPLEPTQSEPGQSWWDWVTGLPGNIAEGAIEAAETAVESGGEAIEAAREYVAGLLGSSEPDSAPETSTVQAPQPQDPEWASKIAAAKTDWEAYREQATAEDPQAAALTRARTVAALGLPDSASDADVNKALSEDLGAAVSGPPYDLTVSLGLPAGCEISIGCIPAVPGGGAPDIDISAAIDSVPGPLAFAGRLLDGFLFNGAGGAAVDVTQFVTADSKLQQLGSDMGIFAALDRAGETGYKDPLTGAIDYSKAYQDYLRLYPEAQDQVKPFSTAIADLEAKQSQAQSSALSVVTAGASDIAAGGVESGSDWKNVASRLDSLVFNKPEVWNDLKDDPLIYDEEGNIDTYALALATQNYYKTHGTEIERVSASAAVEKAEEAEAGFKTSVAMAAPLGVAVMLAGPEIAAGGAGAFIADLFLPAVGGGAIKKLFSATKAVETLENPEAIAQARRAVETGQGEVRPGAESVPEQVADGGVGQGEVRPGAEAAAEEVAPAAEAQSGGPLAAVRNWWDNLLGRSDETPAAAPEPEAPAQNLAQRGTPVDENAPAGPAQTTETAKPPAEPETAAAPEAPIRPAEPNPEPAAPKPEEPATVEPPVRTDAPAEPAEVTAPRTEPEAPAEAAEPPKTILEQAEEAVADYWRRITGEEPAVREPETPRAGEDLVNETSPVREPCPVSELPNKFRLIKEAYAQARNPCALEWADNGQVIRPGQNNAPDGQKIHVDDSHLDDSNPIMGASSVVGLGNEAEAAKVTATITQAISESGRGYQVLTANAVQSRVDDLLRLQTGGGFSVGNTPSIDKLPPGSDYGGTFVVIVKDADGKPTDAVVAQVGKSPPHVSVTTDPSLSSSGRTKQMIDANPDQSYTVTVVPITEGDRVTVVKMPRGNQAIPANRIGDPSVQLSDHPGEQILRVMGGEPKDDALAAVFEVKNPNKPVAEAQVAPVIDRALNTSQLDNPAPAAGNNIADLERRANEAGAEYSRLLEEYKVALAGDDYEGIEAEVNKAKRAYERASADLQAARNGSAITPPNPAPPPVSAPSTGAASDVVRNAGAGVIPTPVVNAVADAVDAAEDAVAGGARAVASALPDGPVRDGAENLANALDPRVPVVPTPAQPANATTTPVRLTPQQARADSDEARQLWDEARNDLGDAGRGFAARYDSDPANADAVANPLSDVRQQAMDADRAVKKAKAAENEFREAWERAASRANVAEDLGYADNSPAVAELVELRRTRGENSPEYQRALAATRARDSMTPSQQAYAEALREENNLRDLHQRAFHRLGGPDEITQQQLAGRTEEEIVAEMIRLETARAQAGARLPDDAARKAVEQADGRSVAAVALPQTPVVAGPPAVAAPAVPADVVPVVEDGAVVLPPVPVLAPRRARAARREIQPGQKAADVGKDVPVKPEAEVEVPPEPLQPDDVYQYGYLPGLTTGQLFKSLGAIAVAGGGLSIATAGLTPVALALSTWIASWLPNPAPSASQNQTQPGKVIDFGAKKPASKDSAPSEEDQGTDPDSGAHEEAPSTAAVTVPADPVTEEAPAALPQPQTNTLDPEALQKVYSVVSAHGDAVPGEDQEGCLRNDSVLLNVYSDKSIQILKNYGKIPGKCNNPLTDGDSCTPGKTDIHNYTQCGGSIGLENLTLGQNYQMTRTIKCGIKPDSKGQYPTEVSYSAPEPVEVGVCKEKEIKDTIDIGQACQSDVECKGEDSYCDSVRGRKICVKSTESVFYAKEDQPKDYADCFEIDKQMKALDPIPPFLEYSCYRDSKDPNSYYNDKKVRIYLNPGTDYCVTDFVDLGPGVNCSAKP